MGLIATRHTAKALGEAGVMPTAPAALPPAAPGFTAWRLPR
jgi:hypothetical protein